MKRKMFALLAAATMMLSIAGAASAEPNENANCAAFEATEFHDISFYARLDHEGGRNFVGEAASSNCGTR